MATITYLSLAGDFAPHVPGVPEPVMEAYIRKVVIDLCDRAKVWRVPFTGQELSQGVWQYTLVAPIAQTELSSILDAKVYLSSAAKWGDMKVLTNEQAFALYPSYPDLDGFTWAGNWDVAAAYIENDAVDDGAGTVYVCLVGNTGEALSNTAYWKATSITLGYPKHIIRFGEQTFSVAPIPDDADTYTVYLVGAVRPTSDSSQFESTIYTGFRRAIYHGVLHELMSVPGVPWTNDKKAEYHGKQWEYLVNAARARANKGFGRADVAVVQRPWA